jgi:hypothetical protein
MAKKLAGGLGLLQDLMNAPFQARLNAKKSKPKSDLQDLLGVVDGSQKDTALVRKAKTKVPAPTCEQAVEQLTLVRADEKFICRDGVIMLQDPHDKTYGIFCHVADLHWGPGEYAWIVACRGAPLV